MTTYVYPSQTSSSQLPLTLGQKTMANSLSVAVASDQSPFPVSMATLTVVDQIMVTPLLDVSGSNIPASSSPPLVVNAGLAAAVKKIVSVEDIGEFFGIYANPLVAPVLLCILPLGGGEIEVNIPMGTIIGIRNMKNAVVNSGFIALNFLG
jgi:hypothetical protein